MNKSNVNQEVHSANPVFQNAPSFRGQDGLRVELNAPYVVFPMPERHNLSILSRLRRYFQARRKILAGNDPRMVAPRHEAFSHPSEERFVGYDADFRGNAMMHLREVQQFCPESLANGLLAQADAQDALLGGITADERKEEGGFYQSGLHLPAQSCRFDALRHLPPSPSGYGGDCR